MKRSITPVAAADNASASGALATAHPPWTPAPQEPAGNKFPSGKGSQCAGIISVAPQGPGLIARGGSRPWNREGERPNRVISPGTGRRWSESRDSSCFPRVPKLQSVSRPLWHKNLRRPFPEGIGSGVRAHRPVPAFWLVPAMRSRKSCRSWSARSEGSCRIQSM